MNQQSTKGSENDIETFRKEFLRWEEFLNGVWGILAFTLALGCLGTHVPWVNAIICGVFLVILRLGANNRFPRSMIRLRVKAKDDPSLRQTLKERDRQFLGIHVLLFRYPLFLIGWAFLGFVALSRGLVVLWPWFNGYFGYIIN